MHEKKPDDPGFGRIIFALSDPLRRRVMLEVARRPDATVTEICSVFSVSRFAIMRHLNVLEGAGIIERRSLGRERRVRLSQRRFEDVVLGFFVELREGDVNDGKDGS